MSGCALVLVSFVIIFNVIEAQVSSIFITIPPNAAESPLQDNTNIVFQPEQVTTSESIFINTIPPPENYQNEVAKTSYDTSNNYDDMTNSDNYSYEEQSQKYEYYDYYSEGAREQKAVSLEPERYEYSQYQAPKEYDSFNRASAISSDNVYSQYQEQSKYEFEGYGSPQEQLYTNSHADYVGTPSSPGYDQQLFLDAHNKHRREHCVDDLSWNENLAQSALKWADTCKFEHSDYGPGENLMYVPYSYIRPEELIDQWVDERQWYDYNQPYFHESYGHFLQAVWKDTTQLGCASSNCGNFQLLVCHYYPRGNVRGRYAENVPPPCAQ